MAAATILESAELPRIRLLRFFEGKDLLPTFRLRLRMPSSNAMPPDAQPSFTLAESAAGVSWESLTPEFYRSNPFRQLGLSVLASSREILKRVDQLKLSAELGAETGTWAFAPVTPPTLDEIRAFAHGLKDPPRRLLHEFFWFWPENYPHDSPDPALECLAQGETIQAGERWSAAAAEGHEVAWHNLAVYHHLLALEWEQNENHDEAALAEVWQQALNYWVQIIDNDTLWERVLTRVALLDDAQLTAESVSRLHAGITDAVAQINATLARHHAELGHPQRVALHLSLVNQIFVGEPARAARVLETVALPAARRIEARIEKSRHDAAGAPASLPTTVALVRENSRDLEVVATLCGSGAEFYLEHCRLLAGAVLDGVVRYQRETADDRGCLPLLWFLRDVPATPELAERIASAQTVIEANALEPNAGQATPGTASDSDAQSQRDRILPLIVDTLIPGLDQLGLTETARQRYALRLADWLKTLAVEACAREEGIDWAAQALTTALTLPCDPDTLGSLATLLDQVRNDFQLRRDKALQIEANGHTLVINFHGIALDDQWLTPGEVAGIRHGVIAGEGDAPPRHVFAWRSADIEYEISETNLLSRETAADEHARILDAVYFFLVPTLIERLIGKLRAGEPLSLGDAQFDRTGVMLSPAGGTRLWKRSVLVPYSQTSYRLEEQFFKISSLENPKLVETVEVLQTWNAVIIGYVIDRLARE